MIYTDLSMHVWVNGVADLGQIYKDFFTISCKFKANFLKSLNHLLNKGLSIFIKQSEVFAITKYILGGIL